MPWLDEVHRVHSCVQPQYVEGEEVKRNGSTWGCPDCGAVYSLLIGKSKSGSATEWTPSYGWMRVAGKVYIPPKES